MFLSFSNLSFFQPSESSPRLGASSSLDWNVLGWSTDLRATLHVHGAHLGPEPAHGLQGRVVVAQLGVAAHEVLPLKDHHATAVVRLQKTES